MGRPRTLPGRAREVLARLGEEYPGSALDLCALVHEDPFQLLVATILSAQTTDERVNTVTPALFARYPNAFEMAQADPREIEKLIFSTGFYRQKTLSLIGMASALVDRHGGKVPTTMTALTALPGVGRKTANVVLGVAFGLPGLPVDTHVGRLARRLGLSAETDPVKIEHELGAMIPARERGRLSLVLIVHGRQVCRSRRPLCEACVLADICPSGIGLSTP